MTEYKAVGVRLEDKFLDRIESIEREEKLDRSSVMRMLLWEGYRNYLKKKAAEAYMQGRMTMSRAAGRAGLTIWEMQEHLLSLGFRSDYGIKELEEETKLLKAV